MKLPSDKFKWIQGSLTAVILIILVFLALSPPSRASTPVGDAAETATAGFHPASIHSDS